jgi:hypothetical protein
MKRAIASILFALCGLWTGMGHAATQSWTWAQQADVSTAAATATATAVATDAAGNTYVAGTYSGTVRFGANTLTSTQGYTDVFLAKYDSTGTVLWAVAAGGMACNAGGVTTDGNEVFLTGHCFYGASFGGHALAAGTTYQAALFLAAADAGTGQFARVLSNGGSGSMYGKALALDTEGSLLVAGAFTKTASVLGTSLAATGGDSAGSDVFVFKINKAFDQLAWARGGGSEDGDNAYAVASDANGNVFIAGDIVAAMAQGTASFGGSTLTVSSSGDPFVAKLDRDGQWQWARGIQGGSFDSARALAADSAGNVYVGGQFAYSATFGGTFLTAAKSSYVAFVAKLDGSGNFLWAPHAGNPASATLAGHAGVYGLLVRGNGNPVASGYYTAETNFGGFTLTSLNKGDVFVAELDAASGGYLWAKSGGGGSGNDFGYAMAQTAGGKLMVAGAFEDSASFDTTSLATGRYTESWIVGMYLASLDPDATPATSTLDGTVAASGALTARTLTLSGMSVPASDLAGGVSFYVAAYAGGNFFFFTPGGWTNQYLPYVSAVTSVPLPITLTNGLDLSGLVGTTVWFGYGRGAGDAALTDMLQGARYKQVYTIQ